MNQFELYFLLGLDHVLDINGYDHLLFLVALALPYTLKDWKQVLWLVTIFTVGHTLSLFLASFGWLRIRSDYIEFLIPITILLAALANLRSSERRIPKGRKAMAVGVTLFFGLIHGLGFSNFFRQVVASDDDKFLPLLEFALGIEVAQVIIVGIALLINGIAYGVLGTNRRSWIVVGSSIIIGITLTLIKDAYPF